jgi:hypothetical protein
MSDKIAENGKEIIQGRIKERGINKKIVNMKNMKELALFIVSISILYNL